MSGEASNCCCMMAKLSSSLSNLVVANRATTIFIESTERLPNNCQVHQQEHGCAEQKTYVWE